MSQSVCGPPDIDLHNLKVVMPVVALFRLRVGLFGAFRAPSPVTLSSSIFAVCGGTNGIVSCTANSSIQAQLELAQLEMAQKRWLIEKTIRRVERRNGSKKG